MRSLMNAHEEIIWISEAKQLTCFNPFTHLELCLADAIHNFKWVNKFQILLKMEVNKFQVLLINATFLSLTGLKADM